VVLIAKEWETLAEVEREDVMAVLKQGDCILRGEYSRSEVVEEDLLTKTNQGRLTHLGVPA
jgi:hypothetical protein